MLLPKTLSRFLSILCLSAGALFCSPHANAQRLALKTNALDYAILTPNLTFEAQLNPKFSLQVGIAGTPTNKMISGVKLTNFRIEPELRYWFNRPMAKHFIALSTSAVAYSLRHNDHIFNGDAIAAGFSYGYALVLGKHWNMEAEIGLGVATFKGYNYTGEENKPAKKNFEKFLPVPMRFALSFGYVF